MLIIVHLPWSSTNCKPLDQSVEIFLRCLFRQLAILLDCPSMRVAIHHTLSHAAWSDENLRVMCELVYINNIYILHMIYSQISHSRWIHILILSPNIGELIIGLHGLQLRHKQNPLPGWPSFGQLSCSQCWYWMCHWDELNLHRRLRRRRLQRLSSIKWRLQSRSCDENRGIMINW